MSGPLHIFGPSHTCENACGRQYLGSSCSGLRDASDLQAPGDGGTPEGPQPQLPAAVLTVTALPRLWSTNEVDVPSYEAAKSV